MDKLTRSSLKDGKFYRITTRRGIENGVMLKNDRFRCQWAHDQCYLIESDPTTMTQFQFRVNEDGQLALFRGLEGERGWVSFGDVVGDSVFEELG